MPTLTIQGDNCTLLKFIRTCIPDNLMKQLQALGAQLDEAFELELSNDCAGGAMGIQLGTACNLASPKAAERSGKVQNRVPCSLLYSPKLVQLSGSTVCGL